MDTYQIELGFSLVKEWLSGGPVMYWMPGQWYDGITITSLRLTDPETDYVVFDLSPRSLIVHEGVSYQLIQENPDSTYAELIESVENYHYRPSFVLGNNFFLYGYNPYSGVVWHRYEYRDNVYTPSSELSEVSFGSFRNLQDTSDLQPAQSPVFLRYKYRSTHDTVTEFAYGHFSGRITPDSVTFDLSVYSNPIAAQDGIFDPQGVPATTYSFEADLTQNNRAFAALASSYISIHKYDTLVFPYSNPTSTDTNTFAFDGTSIISNMSAFAWRYEKVYASGDVIYSSKRKKYYKSRIDNNDASQYGIELPEDQTKPTEDDVLPAGNASSNEWWEEISEQDIIAGSQENSKFIRTGKLVLTSGSALDALDDLDPPDDQNPTYPTVPDTVTFTWTAYSNRV